MTAITERRPELRLEQALESIYHDYGDFGVKRAETLHQSSLGLVLKYGGSTLLQHMDRVTEDTVLFDALGIKEAIAHGAKPQIDQILRVAKIETPLVNGLRETSAKALKVVDTMSRGVNRLLVQRLQDAGVKTAVGVESGVVQAELLDEKLYGHVGKVTAFRQEVILELIADGNLPVYCGLGETVEGRILNVNGDTAAAAGAIALQPDVFIPVTDVPGVVGPEGILPWIDASGDQVEDLITQEVITTGMIPKSRESRDVAKKLDGGLVIVTDIHSVRDALFMPAEVAPGTRFSTNLEVAA